MAMNTPHPPGPYGAPGPRGPSDAEEPVLLACGRDLAALWEDPGRGPDPHTDSCPHCRDALADLHHLRTAALAAGPPPDGPGDTDALARRVMDAVRLELRPGRSLPLGDADEDTWIHEAVAARALRTAAEDVPGVRAGSCRIAPPEGRAGPGRGPVTVHIEVTAAYGCDLRATSGAVRDRTVRAADERLGLAVAAVHVTVTDLHDAPDDRGEARR
ncbi:Asp23/Gls24 family envelope stress response protein [Streptomyces sp. JL4002]|uniref:Asp23/Gls24 family envelope stress response protein n=1 Tax=Streptomyces sp. JL4002 TaxID=3404781 RepID=UPI003B283583